MIAQRYELGPVIGTGGMSEVYEATDTVLGRMVAVKLLRKEMARDSNFRERFRKEAQNAGKLNHAAIVAVYDTGEELIDGISTPYIVMELVKGHNLREIVRDNGVLSPEEAATTLIPVCEALQVSHDAGIIHRDIKPANIMITNTGIVKIMDFGIARALDDSTAAMTQTSAVIGTAQYLSPEQARGKAVDGRSDIYALGCVMYDIITGHPPFEGETPFAVAYQHVQEDPSVPSDFIPGLSPSEALNVNAVVLTAMAKHPGDRYQSATDFAADLRRLERGAVTAAARSYVEEPPAPVVEKRSKVLPIIGATLALASVGFLSYFTYEYFNVKPAPVAQQIMLPDYALVSQEDTVDHLQKLALQPEILEQHDSEVPRGLVIRTNPPANTVLASGAKVTVFVSSGKEIAEVPDLSDKTTAEAAKILKKAGLELAEEIKEDSSETVKEGRVITQSPSPGSQVSHGSKVTITVSKGLAQQRIPIITGMQWKQAETNLTSLGFAPVVETVDGIEPSGTVIFVAGEGSEVDAKSNVEVRISNGQLIALPDLTRKTPHEAQSDLTALGWQGSFIYGDPVKTGALVDGGKIAYQAQNPGTPIRKDATVDISLWEFDITALSP
ncbi:Stk1 family PASTA domain-containing Ser/Thr kinase [Corynebacterium sp. HS2168-gen11]|uniref:Stk1 family PASTA domain-containing Ser/Thr kinase n=1 Tax=Corynebacterium sp. HS2168-gen11 TaxID=2974027 RepID=UPI00216B094F|nr:PASTA domain-containing protein [Corynebacterium sp. HS2168-gen11]MCS4535511.1 PASTA domain-containing protein [Corynebacterium sp. HS2168-gen11]